MRLPPTPVPTSSPLDRQGPLRFETDVVVVGAGVAGLFAAVRLAAVAGPALDVVVLDKGTPGASGSSPWAQGGIAVAVGPEDSPELHAADTLRAGAGLCDAAAVDVLVAEGPRRLEQLIALGARFDALEDGRLHLAREGGQSVPRSVHRADATGAEMVRALRESAAPVVSRLAGTAVGLSHDVEGVTGVWALVEAPAQGAAPRQIRLAHVGARAVLLATGGAGGLFAATTNQETATGDGLALAWRAGAALRDLEFVQFHPTALIDEAVDPAALSSTPGEPGATAAADGVSARALLLTEALRGAGATLHDREGRRFMPDLHPDAELAPRHVVARAILDQEGGAWLDATHLSPRLLEEEFPTALRGARERGFDLARQRVPVSPAAHYQIGGVRTDLDGRTSLPGLYAAGEVASTGAHGANRMAGNSLLEALVFGGRGAEAIAARLTDRQPAGPPPSPPPLLPRVERHEPYEALRAELRAAMWVGCGPIRDAASLAVAARHLGELADRLGEPVADPGHVELHHALAAAGLLVRAAAARTESRGVHHRGDHPDAVASWDDARLEWIRGVRG